MFSVQSEQNEKFSPGAECQADQIATSTFSPAPIPYHGELFPRLPDSRQVNSPTSTFLGNFFLLPHQKKKKGKLLDYHDFGNYLLIYHNSSPLLQLQRSVPSGFPFYLFAFLQRQQLCLACYKGSSCPEMSGSYRGLLQEYSESLPNLQLSDNLSTPRKRLLVAQLPFMHKPSPCKEEEFLVVE